MSVRTNHIFQKARDNALQKQKQEEKQEDLTGIFATIIAELRPVKANPPPTDSNKTI